MGPLVFLFSAHGLDETRGGLGVVPEQPVRCVVVVAVDNEQIEVGAIQRCLEEAPRYVGSAPFDHVVRTQHRVEATGQPIVVVQPADLWPSVCSQPRLDHPVFFDREAVADQNLAHHIIGTVDFELEGSEPRFGGMSKPALNDMCNPIGRRVGHDDRVESNPVVPVGDDYCSFWATEVIEPEELTEIVGRARGAPPPIQVCGFVQPFGGVNAADSLQKRRRSFQVLNANSMLFSHCLHVSKLLRPS